MEDWHSLKAEGGRRKRQDSNVFITSTSLHTKPPHGRMISVAKAVTFNDLLCKYTHLKLSPPNDDR